MPQLKKTAPVAERRPASIEDWLNAPNFRQSLGEILPRHLTSERFAAVAMRQFRLIPGLRQCTPDSILSAFMDAAQLGLEIGLGGEAYLIPYRTRIKRRDENGRTQDEFVDLAQLQIGYLGHLKLAWQSGTIDKIEADVVTREEVDQGRFDFQNGTDGYLRHKPIQDRDLNEKTIAYAYACIWAKGSSRAIFRVLDHKQIQRLRNTGRSANSPAWTNHYDEMAIAKALKRALKWAPKSREIAHAVALDDEADAGIPQSFNSSIDVDSLLPPGAGPKMIDQEHDADASEADGPPPGAAQGNGGKTNTPPPAQQSAPPPSDDDAPPPARGGMGW